MRAFGPEGLKRQAAKIEATEEQKDAERALAVQRGRAAKQFLDSEFWKKFLAPHLTKEADDLAHDALWKPVHTRTLEAVALGCAFNGGRDEQLRGMVQMIQGWVVEGEKALEKLKERGKEA